MNKTISFQTGAIDPRILLKFWNNQPEVKGIKKQVINTKIGLKIIYEGINEEQDKSINDLFYYMHGIVNELENYFFTKGKYLNNYVIKTLKQKTGYTYNKELLEVIREHAPNVGINNINDFIQDNTPKLKDDTALLKKANFRVLCFLHHPFLQMITQHYYNNVYFATDEQLEEIKKIKNSNATNEEKINKTYALTKYMIKGGGNR